jgi:hypothetical protein
MAESGGKRWRRNRHGQHERRKRELTCRVHMSVTGKREGDVAQRRKSKKKTHSNEDVIGALACWAG